jgi:hypothetical protein
MLILGEAMCWEARRVYMDAFFVLSAQFPCKSKISPLIKKRERTKHWVVHLYFRYFFAYLM